MPSTHAASSHRRSFAPIWLLLGAASLVLIGGQYLRLASATVGPNYRAGLALLLPWLVLLIVAVLVALTSGALRLALVAGGGAIAMAFAAPFVVDRLQGFGPVEVVWVARGESPLDLVRSIANGDVIQLMIARWLMLAGMLILLAFAVAVLWQLRDLLLGPAARAGFGIDTTVLLVAFTIAALATGSGGAERAGLSSITGLLDDQWALNVRLLAWLLPLVIWMALNCRQGGALGLGAATGLVVAMLVMPAAIDVIGKNLGDGSGSYAVAVGDSPLELAPYEALDWTGAKPVLGVIALVLLLVALWWAVGVQSSRTQRPIAADTGSPTNWLAVLAFCLAWIPLTAIPAIVLGHMAFDQVSESSTSQRGLGLARWAIILGYLTVFGSAWFSYNTWLKG